MFSLVRVILFIGAGWVCPVQALSEGHAVRGGGGRGYLLFRFCPGGGGRVP